MEHVQIAFWVSGNACDLTYMKVIDRPVADHFEFAAERFVEVLLGVSVAHYFLIFVGKDLPPVVHRISRFIAVAGVDRMKMLRMLLRHRHASCQLVYLYSMRRFIRFVCDLLNIVKSACGCRCHRPKIPCLDRCSILANKTHV